jgi:transcriptional regulator with PAS, ATPase and Fis domain
LAAVLAELISVNCKMGQHDQIAPLVDELEALAGDGEAVGEAIDARWGRALVAKDKGSYVEARKLLDDAYAMAEEVWSWSKGMKILKEQIALGEVSCNQEYRRDKQAIIDGKIEEVLQTLDSEEDRRAFLEGEFGSAYGRRGAREVRVPCEGIDHEIDAATEEVTAERNEDAGGRGETIVGRSDAVRQLLSKIEIAGRGDVGVMILGESGSGKELVARRIHALSGRADQMFLAIDCGAIPENLIESELFGYKRGAFTGADRDKPGIFEEVGGGTLLLDEIGNAGANFQAKLLRVLQEREVRRIGENRSRPVRARVLAATNVDLRAEAESGRFREDLYYRLSVLAIPVPPLRGRKEDIPLLARAFLDEMRSSGQSQGGVSPEALRALVAYNWPGNVRELKNVLQAAALAADGRKISCSHLPEELPRVRNGEEGAGTKQSRQEPPSEDGDRQALEDALRRTGGDKSAACRLLGWNRMKLYRRMRKYGIPLGFGRPPRG